MVKSARALLSTVCADASAMGVSLTLWTTPLMDDMTMAMPVALTSLALHMKP
jgi:hypothetical protein